MPSTPLHAALGEVGNDLTFRLIERACEEGVSERDDLDWKRDLPLTAGQGEQGKKMAQQAELAKDIAAMANSGGGMIVFGVAESPAGGTSTASHIVPVGSVDEVVIKAIRQVASAHVYPPVTGIEVIPVAADDAPEDGVLVLLVRDSLDAPHLVHPRNPPEWFAAPYRHGPDTQWMVERQIADAYRARETGRQRRLREFDDRFDQFIESCGGRTDTNWVVAMAVPESPLPRPRALQLGTADRIIARAWQNWPIHGSIGPKDLTHNEPTRPGLQRFVRAGVRDMRAYNGGRMRARIEVHGDGSVAVAFTRDGFLGPGEAMQRGHVPIQDIEQTGVEFFALLWTAVRALGVPGDYIARIGVIPSTQIFRRSDPLLLGTFTPFDESHRVLGYRPVDGPILASAGLETALASWFDIVVDAVNQAGVLSRLDSDRFLAEMAADF